MFVAVGGSVLTRKPEIAARLDPASPLPLYQQLVILLRHRIDSGALAPGDRVAGEAELCAQYGVSRVTARRALDELAQAGLVERRRGSGTRVCDGHGSARPTPLSASIEGFLENIGQIGRSTSVRVLSGESVLAPSSVARCLDMAPGTAVQHAVRVRSFGDVPISFLETWVPADIYADIAAKVHQPAETPVPMLLLLEEAGVEAASARQTIGATLADMRVAAALGIAAGAPLIEVQRTVRDRDGRAVEHVHVLYRPEHYRFEVQMERIATEDGRAWQTGRGSD